MRATARLQAVAEGADEVTVTDEHALTGRADRLAPGPGFGPGPGRDPVRVCHLIHDLGPGGAEHVLVDLAMVSATAGFDMSVVSMMPIDGVRYAEVLRDRGIPVRSLGLRAWWDPRGPRRLQRIVTELRPEVLHSHLKHADFVAGRVAERTGLPQVSTLHVIEDAVSGMRRFKRALATRARRRTAAMTIAVSDAQRRWYLEMSGEDPARVVTVHNGIPDPGRATEAQRRQVRTELGVGDDAVVAAMVAVMRPGKGHDVLLAALPRLADGVVVVLAGDGELMPQVAARARRHPGRVVITGFREDVPRLLSGVDLVVHPSRADAFPTALVYAAAAGLPVVASAVGGIPEIVTVSSGILVAPDDPVAIADAINRLAADPAARARMGASARARFEEEFSSSGWVAHLRHVYEAVLAG